MWSYQITVCRQNDFHQNGFRSNDVAPFERVQRFVLIVAALKRRKNKIGGQNTLKIERTLNKTSSVYANQLQLMNINYMYTNSYSKMLYNCQPIMLLFNKMKLPCCHRHQDSNNVL